MEESKAILRYCTVDLSVSGTVSFSYDLHGALDGTACYKYTILNDIIISEYTFREVKQCGPLFISMFDILKSRLIEDIAYTEKIMSRRYRLGTNYENNDYCNCFVYNISLC